MKLLVGIILIIILVAVLRAGELYTQFVRYQRYWDKVNQKPIASGEIVYVALGDSAAQGIGASNPDKGYVGLIAKELAKNSTEPIHVINLSKSGAKISDVLDTQLPRYEELKIPNKQILTIEIGANDIVSFDEQKFNREMNELMGKLPKATVISDIPAFKGSRHANLDPRVDKANSIIYTLAKKHGFELAKLHENVEKNHGLRTFGADFFHPSNYGYKANWLPAFWTRIQAGEDAM